MLNGVTWTSIATDGGACRTASGAGPIATTSTCRRARRQPSSPRHRGAGCHRDPRQHRHRRSARGHHDPVPGNDTATDTTAITASADVQVTKTASSGSAMVGKDITSTTVVTNVGPRPPSASRCKIHTDRPDVHLEQRCLLTAFPCPLGRSHPARPPPSHPSSTSPPPTPAPIRSRTPPPCRAARPIRCPVNTGNASAT